MIRNITNRNIKLRAKAKKFFKFENTSVFRKTKKNLGRDMDMNLMKTNEKRRICLTLEDKDHKTNGFSEKSI